MVAGIVTMLAVYVAVAKYQMKRRFSRPSSKPLGASRITPTLASMALPLGVEPAAVVPRFVELPPKTHPPEVFRKEQALLAASQGRLARSQLLLILDNARRLGLSVEEVSVFEAALTTAAPSTAKELPETISNPEPVSGKRTLVKPPQEERVPFTTYVPHNSPPLVVQDEKRKSCSLPLANGRGAGSVYGEYRAAGESLPRHAQKPIPLPVKPQEQQEWEAAKNFVLPAQKGNVPVSAPADANSEVLPGAADTAVACDSCGECFPSNHELRSHGCVLLIAESREPELPCGGCGRCYACQYLRITRGE